MRIESYKGREIDFKKTVRVYRNLNKKGVVWSVQQKGKVVAHATDLSLTGCVCLINHETQGRVRKSKQRQVHAYIEGIISRQKKFEKTYSITYKPFEHDYFYTMDITSIPVFIQGGDYMHFGPNGVTVADPF